MRSGDPGQSNLPNRPAAVRGRQQGVTCPPQSFADLGVSRAVVEPSPPGHHRAFSRPAPVVPDVLAGRDVLVKSPTGSGKTLAFGVPMVELHRARRSAAGALVLAPTRELAAPDRRGAAAAGARARACPSPPSTAAPASSAQIKLARRAHIVVATPGRLEDLIGRGASTLGQSSILVLDEADRMLDMGFRPAVDRIVARYPRDRQTLFFSATLDGEVGRSPRAYTRTPAATSTRRRRSAGRRDTASSPSPHEAKLDALVRELRRRAADRTLVFVRTKRGADRLVKRLRAR